jgi:predicted PurR-regulated permease PerM
VFGSILSSIPIVIVGLASGAEGVSLTTGVEILCWIVGIHLLEANVLNPKIIGSAAKIHPVVVVFALLVGEETGGLPGALLAVPFASVVQAVFLYLHRHSKLAEQTR